MENPKKSAIDIESRVFRQTLIFHTSHVKCEIRGCLQAFLQEPKCKNSSIEF